MCKAVMPENHSPAKLAVMMQLSQTETQGATLKANQTQRQKLYKEKKALRCLASSISEERLQRGDTISLWRLRLADIFPGQLPILDVLLTHERLEEAYNLVNRWRGHADDICDALVHCDTLWDVLCEVPICEVNLPATLDLLHRTAEALVTV